MLNIYLGEYQLVKQSISQLSSKYNMKIKYCDDIFTYHNNGLFDSPKILYTLYDSRAFKKFDADFFDRSNNIYCVIIEDIDKKSSFYRKYKDRIILVGKQKRKKNLVNELYKDLHVLNTIDEKNRLSFLYGVYYDGRAYSKAAGYCINEVLTGKIPVKNIFQIFVLTI